MQIENAGQSIDTIDVSISYRIIDLFSGGLYSSPNKAFEELVCNSYDAFANQVAIYIPSDMALPDAYIWFCDNGESMDSEGLKQLWKIGDSLKRTPQYNKSKRKQIGKFGIGKLATYVLARKLTYLCKRDKEFLAVTMNYESISKNDAGLKLEQRKLSLKEAKAAIDQLVVNTEKPIIPFKMFGKDAEINWTFTILHDLRPKCIELKEGRLRWVLRTALPLNPGFRLFLNGEELDSSKVNKPMLKQWDFGVDDKTATDMKGVKVKKYKGEVSIDFENLKGVSGRIELYEDSLLDETKSSGVGRSHGIFLQIRGRLINIDDPLLGMDAFSHGVFNRTRIIVNADNLDEYLTSARESIKDSPSLTQLKQYIKKKFNNEVRKYYENLKSEKDKSNSLLYRLSKTSLTTTKTPILVFTKKYFDGEINNPFTLIKPNIENKDSILEELQNDITSKNSIIKDVKWGISEASKPLAQLDIETGMLLINLLHPYISNYMDTFQNTLPLEVIATNEVLTEAHLYEIGVREDLVNDIMLRRDLTLRELALAEKISAPSVAIMLKDALADSSGLEDAVCSALRSLGFEASQIGGNGKPDGQASARLGYSSSDKNENYSLTFDAKSTAANKIQANTTHLATINKHKDDYKADFALVVARDFEGADDPNSNISITAKKQKVTVMRASDLIRLLLLSIPKQIGLAELKDLFMTCYAPADVTNWVNEKEKKVVDIGPVKEFLDAVYKLQSDDFEPPEFSSVRMYMNTMMEIDVSKDKLVLIASSISTFVPDFITIERDKVGIQAKPEQIISALGGAINRVPHEVHNLYLDVFRDLGIKSS